MKITDTKACTGSGKPTGCVEFEFDIEVAVVTYGDAGVVSGLESKLNTVR